MIFDERKIKHILSYPRPDMRREYKSLDGLWKINLAESREAARKMLNEYCRDGDLETEGWQDILVPYCIESRASGIGCRLKKVFAVYYRTFEPDKNFSGEILHLHIGAVDHTSEIYINGRLLHINKAGYTPIHIPVAKDNLRKGPNTLVIYVEDSLSPAFLRGKQSVFKNNRFVFYTPVSGIWQSVWLENSGRCYLIHYRAYTGLTSVKLELFFSQEPSDFVCELVLGDRTKKVRKKHFRFNPQNCSYACTVDFERERISAPCWSPEAPRLIPFSIRTYEQTGARKKLSDKIETQFGIHTVEIRGDEIHLNGFPLYQKLVLNQGYYPQGWYTPLSRDEYINDINLMKAAGFNGMRIHEKLEDPAFLFCCDAMGMLVWEEIPSPYIMSKKTRQELDATILSIIRRDFNHVCIITWVVFNESWGLYNTLFSKRYTRILKDCYCFMKTLDPSRPVIDNSGFYHGVTDIIDIHHYLPGIEFIKAYYRRLFRREFRKFTLKEFLSLFVRIEQAQPEIYNNEFNYTGQPIIISEFGGYGFYQSEKKDFIEIYREWVNLIREYETLRGFCYTQFTDVEQEQNGLFTFERSPKASLDKIRAITSGSGY